MERRDFITFLGGAVVAGPLGVSAQQPSTKIRRVGVINYSAMWATGNRDFFLNSRPT